MSEKEDNSPHNLSYVFEALFVLSLFAIVVILCWGMLSTIIPPPDKEILLQQTLLGICIVGAASVIFIFILALLPRRCGVKIYITKGNNSEHCECKYYQYTNNEPVDVSKTTELISDIEQQAQKMNEKQQEIDAEKQVCCNKHQSIMSSVEQERGNHGN
jgi:hypothetical protein